MPCSCLNRDMVHAACGLSRRQPIRGVAKEGRGGSNFITDSTLLRRKLCVAKIILRCKIIRGFHVYYRGFYNLPQRIPGMNRNSSACDSSKEVMLKLSR
nr:hypothetical protein SHINE37_30208 [Rhizobiaceae bacterium]